MLGLGCSAFLIIPYPWLALRSGVTGGALSVSFHALYLLVCIDQDYRLQIRNKGLRAYVVTIAALKSIFLIRIVREALFMT